MSEFVLEDDRILEDLLRDHLLRADYEKVRVDCTAAGIRASVFREHSGHAPVDPILPGHGRS